MNKRILICLRLAFTVLEPILYRPRDRKQHSFYGNHLKDSNCYLLLLLVVLVYVALMTSLRGSWLKNGIYLHWHGIDSLKLLQR